MPMIGHVLRHSARGVRPRAPSASPPPPSPPTAPSPTGRDPTILWTGAQQAIYNQQVAESFEPMTMVLANADLTNTVGERYADYGYWATVAFQVTGDTDYAQAAYQKLCDKNWIWTDADIPITNRQFEDWTGGVPDGWTVAAGTATEGTSDPYRGTSCLQLVSDGSTVNKVRQQMVGSAVVAGVYWVLQFRCKVSATGAGRVGFRLTDGAGGSVLATNGNLERTWLLDGSGLTLANGRAVDTDWTKLVFYRSSPLPNPLPSGGVWLEFYLDPPPANGVIVSIDLVDWRSVDFDVNTTREAHADCALMYDWCYPGLTATQRTEWADFLEAWCGLTLEGEGWGTRVNDSDQASGHYGGVALTDMALGTDYLSQSWVDGTITIKPVGGVASTGVNRDTLRNALGEFAVQAEGGEWIESTQYNHSTPVFLSTTLLGVWTATGTDHLGPDVGPVLRDMITSSIHNLTPDLNGTVAWGDVEGDAHDPAYIHHFHLMGMLQGVALRLGYTQEAAWANRYMHDLGAKFGWDDTLNELGPRHIVAWDPYSAQADYRTEFPAVYHRPGMGVTSIHNGWDLDDSLVSYAINLKPQVDHEWNSFSDFQAYREGEWVFDKPFVYSKLFRSGWYVWTVLTFGMSGAYHAEVAAKETAADDSWDYLCGTSFGTVYPAGYRDNPPEEFIHEKTRSHVYLRSDDKLSDTVVVYDRVDSEDPQLLPLYEQYYQTEQDIIEGALAPKTVNCFAPTSPTTSATEVTWATAGGLLGRISTLLPSGTTKTVVDLTTDPLFSDAHNLIYRVQIVPPSDNQFERFLNVHQQKGTGNWTGYTNVAVQSSAGSAADGVHVVRPSHDDVVVMFSAVSAARVLTAGYTFAFTAGTANSTVLLFDLDPAMDWSYTVNGGGSNALTVSSAGVAEFVLSGTGAKTIVLTGV